MEVNTTRLSTFSNIIVKGNRDILTQIHETGSRTYIIGVWSVFGVENWNIRKKT